MKSGKLLVAAIVLSGLGLVGYRLAARETFDLAEVEISPIRVNTMTVKPRRQGCGLKG